MDAFEPSSVECRQDRRKSFGVRLDVVKGNSQIRRLRSDHK